MLVGPSGVLPVHSSTTDTVLATTVRLWGMNNSKIRRISHACLNCQKRKVKCNGNLERCQQCSHLNLRCIYAPAKPSAQNRTRSARGSVISRLRGTPSESPTAENDQNNTGVAHDVASVLSRSGHMRGSEFSKEFFRSLVPQYEEYVYCVNPVITASEMLEQINRIDTDCVAYMLVHSFGCATLFLTTPDWKSNEIEVSKIKSLKRSAIAARSHISGELITDSREGNKTLKDIVDVRLIVAYLFLEVTLLAFDMNGEAFIVLREAINFIQLLGIDNNRHLPALERTRCTRLYWVAFVHERYLAIASNYPPVLPALPLEWPLFPDDGGAYVHIYWGFKTLTQLFNIIDEQFVKYWMANDRNSGITADWVEMKRQQLEILSHNELLTKRSGLNDIQLADLIVTRYWIMTLLWQIAISNWFLPLQSHSSAMSLEYPIRLSQQLRQVVTQLKRQNIERNGSGIIYKLFEITNTIADVIIHVPAATETEDLQRKDDFNTLLNFLYDFASLNGIQIDILAEKGMAVKGQVPGKPTTNLNNI